MREQLVREVDGAAQLVDEDGRRSAAEVHRREVVAHVGDHAHLVAERGVVARRALVVVEEAVESAVCAEPLAEGHVAVEDVLLAGLRSGECLSLDARAR